MLQKILVVLVGLVMSLVGALAPDAFTAADAALPATPAGAVEAKLATVRAADGEPFARVSVLWAEADGRRVTEEAWGTGSLDTVRFKVGTKGVDGLALAVGDKLVPLHPTDVVTVRLFSGDFAFRDPGTAKATVQLSGTIKAALVKPGEATSRVLTGSSGGEAAPGAVPGDVAYVVLDTGERLDTARVDDGGDRLVTTEAADAGAEAGNLLVRWVRIDGRTVQEHTWGEGAVGRIEFEPAAHDGSGLRFAGAAEDFPSGSRVVVTDFVGDHLAYPVAGGLSRLRLDGYAGDVTIGSPASNPVQAGVGAPVASFEYGPPEPRTTDTLRFTDKSTDDTAVVFREWSFGDGNVSVLPNPSHRFRQPGVYNVTLRVTDTDRQSSETYAVIAVENAEPIPDFDFWPAVVTTDTIVTFNDGSEDPDGAVVSWAWDFGDGTTSDDRNPSHSFSASGPATVRLTVVDDRGASASVSKVVDVRNTPPMARFNYSPNDVQTLVPVLFQDDSADKDGTIVSRAWNFGDGTTASGPSVEHSFARPGVFTVSLTVTDNAGDSDTTTATILVRNRLPLVSFSWSPVGATSDVPVQFTSLSTDPDGTILVYQWGFGDGTTVSNGGPAVTHQFPRAGTYNVTLTVTDSMLQTNSSTVEVGIANAIPRPQIGVSPNPVFRGVEVALVDLSTDPDGDAIVERTWDLGPGVDPAHDAVVRHVFTETGLYPVKLTVRDAAGNSASTSTTVRVTNRPPVVSSVSSWPPFPNVDQPTYFNASGADVDAQPGDPEVRYEWRFSDGVTLAGAEVVRTFANPGRVGATVRLYDYENASSNPATTGVDVQLALPAVAFAWAPATPASGEPVSFRSLSTSLNGPITSASWDFDDGTAAQGESVDHVFEDGRTYLVRLTVTDNRSRSASLQLPVRVNDRPVADFAVSRQGVVPLGVPVAFSDLSRDPDGSVTHWQWDFGDGASNEPSPTHAFTTPGEHHVELTVTDNEGAADTTVRVVRVENRPPVARWAATGGALVGDVFAFQSRAFDPDGLPLASWYWSFGDGTTSRAENPTHVYAQSGHYTVSLQVTDGELASRAEPGSYGVVRVGADHAVDVLVRAVLPDGSPADLNSGDYAVSAVVGQGAFGFQTIQGSRLLASGATDRTFRLDANEWVRGDFVVVSLAAPGYFPEVVRKTWALAEHDGVTRAVEVVLEVPMPLVATLAPASGARDALPDLPLIAPNAETTPDGDAVYRDLTEAFRGAGVVRFADGTPVFGATVQIETRYLGARALAAPRESLTQDGNLLGWCLADTRTTGADGAYAWTFEAARSACAPHDLGVNPIGRWEVRAKVMFSFAPTAQTATRAIYVDPTGGLLWSASAPP